MSNPAHVPAILQEPRRHRYLKLIALFKIGKGVLLLLLGVSLLFLNARTRWMDAISDWAILNAMINAVGGATWVSFHHGGGVGMGYSQHAGQVIVADGTPEAARRLEAQIQLGGRLGRHGVSRNPNAAHAVDRSRLL